MTSGTLNPFNNLYRTESISASTFAELFSPVLLKESVVQRIFEPGNVIVCGLQGSGKSALLNLLKPEVLTEFIRGGKWPIPAHCSKFLSTSVTLRSSGALQFGQRKIEDSSSESDIIVGLYFADFLNYWIVYDLLERISFLKSSAGKPLSERIGLKIDEDSLNLFSERFSEHSCWVGGVQKVNDFNTLMAQIKSRIVQYENFLNYNTDFPLKFVNTKTRAGEPIAVASDLLRVLDILPNDVPLFVTIDQFEDLMDLERKFSEADKPIFRTIIMNMLGNRDDRVSYRIGARLYSLENGISGLRGNPLVEEMREVNVVNIDELLQGRENRKSLFPEFCNDVLCRRLKEAGYEVPKTKKSILSYVFSDRISPEQKVQDFITKSRVAVISNTTGISEDARKALKDVAKQDPISAKLGEAWLRQNSNKDVSDAEIVVKAPWRERQWWKKERKQQALLQVFSACNQKMVWGGAFDIISLSGRNILIFLSMCQFIWAEYLRSVDGDFSSIPKEIAPVIQTLGINSASDYWFRKIKAEPKGGDDRYRFANVIGTKFRDMLRKDVKMTYPGHNGFSLSINQLEDEPVVEDFLSNCVAFGVLESRPHTSKTPSRGRSEKWYLSPILSPHFQIPMAHIKEPYYAGVSEVAGWMKEAGVVTYGINTETVVRRRNINKSSNSNQLSFFFDEPER